jgi:hypothetical protein
MTQDNRPDQNRTNQDSKNPASHAGRQEEHKGEAQKDRGHDASRAELKPREAGGKSPDRAGCDEDDDTCAPGAPKKQGSASDKTQAGRQPNKH